MKIQEPHIHSKRTPLLATVGIDLGTTYSLIATVDPEGHPYLLPDSQGHCLMPSVVRCAFNGTITVGVEALAGLPQNSILLRSTKRWLGQSPEQVATAHPHLPWDLSAPLPTVQCGNRTLNAIEVAAELLKTLYARAITSIEQPVVGAVITVPAYFDETARQATLQAAHQAGVPVLRLLAEPTAAALVYGWQQARPWERVMVVDLGGGTLDVSCVFHEAGTYQVVAVSGDTQLGGDDLDRAIATHWHQEHPALAFDQLLILARQAKEALSEQETVTVRLETQHLTLNRAQLMTYWSPYQTRLEACVQQAQQDSAWSWESIEALVLVGGSSRLPWLADRLHALTQRPVFKPNNPDTVVAQGAAIHAAQLSRHPVHSELLLLDVTPLSLGVEMAQGIVEKLIPRNSPIPCQQKMMVTTQVDGQTALDLHIVQGERECAQDCRSLGHVILKDIPPMRAGLARIEVLFQLDVNGVLSVQAQEYTTGQKVEQRFQPTYGLTAEVAHEMVLEAARSAESDLAQRHYAETAYRAKQLLQYWRERTLPEPLACAQARTDFA